MTVVVTAATSAGSACGSSTLKTMVQVPPPIDWAASISPWSTSRSAASTSRAKNGMAAITRGTTAPVGPMETPTIRRVKGISATIRIRKGKDRPMFTTAPMILLTTTFCRTPPRSVRISRTPSGTPNRTA